jgi:riboflavin kinase/FMN adenylyltransferase
MNVTLGLEKYEGTDPAVVTVGTFDGIHLGHVKLIGTVVEIAKQKQMTSTVMTFDPHPKTVVAQRTTEKFRLLTNLEEKLGLLQDLDLSQVVVAKFTREFSELDYQSFVRDILLNRLRTKVLVVGHDHAFGKDRAGNISALETLSRKYGFQLVEVGPFRIGNKTVSSTAIRKLIADGEVQEAAVMLGRLYALTGVVSRGEGRGRALTYPTANLAVHNNAKLIPRGGVYAVDCRLRTDVIRGMANIGYKPTFGGVNKTLEVHLIGFEGDIYGEQLRIEFLKRLRDEKKFNSENELIEQLAKDKQQSINL